MENESNKITRRNFLKHSSISAGAVGLIVSSAFAQTKAPGANDRIRLGAIGTGGRCRNSLMKISKNQPGTELAAICDVYEPNLLQAIGIVPNAKRYRDYRALLDDQSIDAVLIGSPDHWHARMTMDAVRAGKDVYIEKPVTHSLEEGAELIRVVESSNRVVQTGTQQRSWEHFILGKQLVDSGKLGTITFVRCWWFQNYNSRRSPGDFKSDKLDRKAWLGSAPDQELTPMKFFWWRWYWDFGGGALTDLMSHWIDVVHWYTSNPAPMSAMTNGNRYILEWECPDTITCVLDYPKKFSVTYHGQMASSIDDGGLEIRGTKATMKLDRSRLAIFPEEGGLIGKLGDVEPEILLRSTEDGTIAHIRNFLACIRSRQTPTANIRVAVDAARAAHLGNLSLRQERKIRWNAKQERVETD